MQITWSLLIFSTPKAKAGNAGKADKQHMVKVFNNFFTAAENNFHIDLYKLKKDS